MWLSLHLTDVKLLCNTLRMQIYGQDEELLHMHDAIDMHSRWLNSRAMGIQQLVMCLQDPVVSIDLEWKPEWRRKDSSKVAMIQLATSTVALLIRMSHLGFKMQQDLEQFLRYDDCDLLPIYNLLSRSQGTSSHKVMHRLIKMNT